MGKETLEAWTKDFALSNNMQSDNHIESNEGDLFVDELLDDDIFDNTQDLERSTTPYSWRFDDADLCAQLDLQVGFICDVDYQKASCDFCLLGGQLL